MHIMIYAIRSDAGTHLVHFMFSLIFTVNYISRILYVNVCMCVYVCTIVQLIFKTIIATGLRDILNHLLSSGGLIQHRRSLFSEVSSLEDVFPNKLTGCPEGGNFHFWPAAAVVSSLYCRFNSITWSIRFTSSLKAPDALLSSWISLNNSCVKWDLKLWRNLFCFLTKKF